MKKQLLSLLLIISASLGANAQTSWSSGTGLGGTDVNTWSVHSSVVGNAIQLSSDYGFIFGDQPNNNFFRANTDCNCAEIRTSSGFSFVFLQSLTHDIEITVPNRDFTFAGTDELPYMTSLTASGVLGGTFYTFSIPSGKTLSIVQSNDVSTSVVTGSSISGTVLTVYVSFSAAGIGNLHFTAFLK